MQHIDLSEVARVERMALAAVIAEAEDLTQLSRRCITRAAAYGLLAPKRKNTRNQDPSQPRYYIEEAGRWLWDRWSEDREDAGKTHDLMAYVCLLIYLRLVRTAESEPHHYGDRFQALALGCFKGLKGYKPSKGKTYTYFYTRIKWDLAGHNAGTVDYEANSDQLEDDAEYLLVPDETDDFLEEEVF